MAATTSASFSSMRVQPAPAPLIAVSDQGCERSKPECSNSRRVPSPCGSSRYAHRVFAEGAGPRVHELARRHDSSTSQWTMSRRNSPAGSAFSRNVKRWPTRGSKSFGNIHSARSRAVGERAPDLLARLGKVDLSLDRYRSSLSPFASCCRRRSQRSSQKRS